MFTVGMDVDNLVSSTFQVVSYHIKVSLYLTYYEFHDIK